jgi:hypothetical protein
MALTLPKLALPKPALSKKQIPAIAVGVLAVAAAGWFGWQYFAEEAAPPPAPRKPQALTAAKPPAPEKAAAPADTSQARDKLIEDVLVATGLKQQLNLLPARLMAGVRQSGKQQANASAATVKAIEDAVIQSFTAEGFQGRVSAELKKNFDQKRMQALLEEFSKPAAKSMIELERASPPPEVLAQFARSAAATKPSRERAGLVKRIDAATRASDLAVETAFVSMKQLSLGIAGANARKAAAIDRSIERQRAAATKNIRDATLLNIAFSFKGASDAELENYAAVYEAENSKWFYGLVYAALLEQVRSASAEAGERISELAQTPAAAAAQPARSKAGADARSCLGLATNTAVIKCAEEYR